MQVAGSLPSPRPPRPFAVAGRAPEGFPSDGRSNRSRSDDLLDLGLLFEALPRALVPPRGRSSSREIRMPLRRHLLCASTPGSKLPSARRCNLSSTFRPRGISPPRRFTPHTGPRACCIPQPARVRRVSEAAEPVPSEDGGGPPSLLPATRVHTLRRVSSSTAGAASLRSVAILSLPALIRSSPRPKQR